MNYHKLSILFLALTLSSFVLAQETVNVPIGDDTRNLGDEGSSTPAPTEGGDTASASPTASANDTASSTNGSASVTVFLTTETISGSTLVTNVTSTIESNDTTSEQAPSTLPIASYTGSDTGATDPPNPDGSQPVGPGDDWIAGALSIYPSNGGIAMLASLFAILASIVGLLLF